MTIRHRAHERGQALVWFVVMVPFFLSVIGLAIDGQAVLRAHRRAQLAADAAARTGAEQIQIGHARGQPGAPDILDPTAAQQAAAQRAHNRSSTNRRFILLRPSFSPRLPPSQPRHSATLQIFRRWLAHVRQE